TKNREKRLKMLFIRSCKAAIFEKNQLVWQIGKKCDLFSASLAVVVFLTIISGLWLLMTKSELVKRFDSASSTIKEILKLNYNKVLMESEIDECVDPVITKNRIYLKTQIKRYSCWWIAILGVFIFLFVVANRYFLSTESKNDNKTMQQPVKIDEKIIKK
ncbi:hypothetical protein, partial [Methylobacter sp.]|uniref:hypothetical protein n=1 Tax=Methylobacter sp. TaxID=2051955 RepID=UPI0025CC35EE